MKKKPNNEKTKVFKKKTRKKLVKRAFAPPWAMPVVLSQVFTEDVNMRHMEYLDAMSEMSGSKEGNELESLSNLNHEQIKNQAYHQYYTIEDEEFLNE